MNHMLQVGALQDLQQAEVVQQVLLFLFIYMAIYANQPHHLDK